MEGVSPRQQLIMTLARQMGSVTVDDLALRFDVTPQTTTNYAMPGCWREPMAGPCFPRAWKISLMRRAA
jgi:hypothetical protein